MTEEMKVDINETVSALRDLKPGARMVYYSGDLAWAREYLPESDKANLRFIQSTAWGLYLEGRITLTQRRLAEFVQGIHGNPPVWDYIATGCHPPYVKRMDYVENAHDKAILKTKPRKLTAVV